MKVLSEIHILEHDVLQKAKGALVEPAMELAASANGREALICGGRGEDGYLLDSAHVMEGDLSPRRVAPLPEKRARHAVAAGSPREFFVVGGITEQSDGSLGLARSVFLYEVKDESWRTVAQLPKVAAQLVSEFVSGRLVVIGGDTGVTTCPGAPISPAKCRSDVQILDTKTGKWSSGRPKPTPETGITSAVANGEIFVVSSYNDAGTINALVEAYNVKADTWRTLPDMPSPRTGVACAVIDGNLVCVNGLGRNLKPVARIEYFNLKTNEWRGGAPVSVALADAAYFAMGGRLVLCGGRGGYIL